MEFKPETGLVGLLAALDSDQWPTVRDALDHTFEVLRHREINNATHAKISPSLVKLATHPKWEVRKALAHTVLHLRHESFDRIMTVLDKDDHDLVRNAARRTIARRSELSRTDLLKDQHGDNMLRWLADLEAKHGTNARNAARRVAEKLHSQFVKEVYHEIIKAITPLDASLGNIDIALSKPRVNKEELQRRIHRARDRVSFLVAILDSLVELTRDADPEFHTESLQSMAEEAIHLVRDRKPENQPLSAEVQIDPGITVEANRHLVLQALTNIIQNSVEAYAGARPQVVISATEIDDRLVRMTIADQGCGMTEEAVGDAFVLFSTSKPRGTGIGLTIAKKIIEADHKGTVHLESAKGQGTTVTIMLPIEQEVREW